MGLTDGAVVVRPWAEDAPVTFDDVQVPIRPPGDPAVARAGRAVRGPGLILDRSVGRSPRRPVARPARVTRSEPARGSRPRPGDGPSPRTSRPSPGRIGRCRTRPRRARGRRLRAARSGASSASLSRASRRRSSSCTGTTSPVRPSATISTVPPAAVVTIGTPAAAASSTSSAALAFGRADEQVEGAEQRPGVHDVTGQRDPVGQAQVRDLALDRGSLGPTAHEHQARVGYAVEQVRHRGDDPIVSLAVPHRPDVAHEQVVVACAPPGAQGPARLGGPRVRDQDAVADDPDRGAIYALAGRDGRRRRPRRSRR